MMGGPASGKSTVRRERFPGVQVLDSDDFKQAHPDYDPKNPQVLHAWSAQELVQSLFRALAGDEDFVYDGTGSTVRSTSTTSRKPPLLVSRPPWFTSGPP